MADFEGEVQAVIGDYEKGMDDEDMDDDMDEYEKGVKGKGKEKGKGKGKGMDYMDDDSDDERAQIESQLNWGGDEVIPDDVNAKEWVKSAHNSGNVLTGIKDIDGSVAAIDGSDSPDTHTYAPGLGKGTPNQFVMARQQQLLKQQEDVSKKTSVPPPPSSPPPSGRYQKGKGRKKSKRKKRKSKYKRKKRQSNSKRKKRKSKSKRM
jgi:hypothetical protein